MGDLKSTVKRPIDLQELLKYLQLEPFIDKRGEPILKYLFAECGAREHSSCPTMMPRIGTEAHPNRWIGWQHCACKCHKFVETKDGWTCGPADEIQEA